MGLSAAVTEHPLNIDGTVSPDQASELRPHSMTSVQTPLIIRDHRSKTMQSYMEGFGAKARLPRGLYQRISRASNGNECGEGSTAGEQTCSDPGPLPFPKVSPASRRSSTPSDLWTTLQRLL